MWKGVDEPKRISELQEWKNNRNDKYWINTIACFILKFFKGVYDSLKQKVIVLYGVVFSMCQ